MTEEFSFHGLTVLQLCGPRKGMRLKKSKPSVASNGGDVREDGGLGAVSIINVFLLPLQHPGDRCGLEWIDIIFWLCPQHRNEAMNWGCL